MTDLLFCSNVISDSVFLGWGIYCKRKCSDTSIDLFHIYSILNLRRSYYSRLEI